MKKITKPTIIILTAIMIIIPLISILSSCSGLTPYKEGSGELKIVKTTFAPFDLTRQITGERAEITLLQSNGGDLHDYTPTTAALASLKDADIFVCVGGVTDSAWLDSAINACENPDLKVIKLTELCKGELAELEGHNQTPYCTENHDHDHDSHGHSTDDGHHHEADEHVWLSPKNALLIVEAIAKECVSSDPQNAAHYEANRLAYTATLAALDQSYTDAVAASENKTVAVADRFPFIYLTHDYGLCYYAAFSGCSTETDASFETAVRLLTALESNHKKAIMVTESDSGNPSKSLAKSRNCEIVEFNSMQSVTAAQIKDGATYLSIMQSNLHALRKALA